MCYHIPRVFKVSSKIVISFKNVTLVHYSPLDPYPLNPSISIITYLKPIFFKNFKNFYDFNI